MQRKRRKTKNLVIIFALIIACLYVGYSLITSSLQVRTSLDVAKTSFDVHFENIIVDDESTIETLPTLSEDNTKLNFNITLNAPGDSYIINADIINAGTLDAAISNIDIEGIDDSLSRYITTSLNYKIDNVSLAVDDIIGAGEEDSIEMKIEYNYSSDENEDILLNEPINVDITLNIEFVNPDKTRLDNNEYNIRAYQAYYYILNKSVADNKKSNYVSSSDGIDFSKTASDTNGKGIYTIASTINDTYPISYYRGDIDNNYVIVNNFCWKIVRTTSTGGVKLIFSDIPNSDGTCSEDTDVSTYFSLINDFSSKYNNYYSDNAYIGFMYGQSESNSYEETHRNTNKSEALKSIESFYNSGNLKLSNFSENKEINNINHVSLFNENVLEMQPFCNDRSLANDVGAEWGFNNLGYSNNNTVYSGFKRVAITYHPTLTCNENDEFTNYYGMLTADEAMYAGLVMYNENIEYNSNYLNFYDLFLFYIYF